MSALVWCAQWQRRDAHGRRVGADEWCAIQRQADPPPKYDDGLATLCAHWITLTGGIERRRPTCPECLAALERYEAAHPPRRRARSLDDL